MYQQNKYWVLLILLFTLTFSNCLKAQDTLAYAQTNSIRKEADYLFNAGQKMMDKGLFEKAEILLTRSIALQPNNLEAWNLRATSRERLGMLDAAILDYNHILKIAPTRFDALFSRSLLFYETDRYPLAIEGFDQLLTMPVGETKAVYFKGTSYKTNGETSMSGIVTLNTEQGELYHYRGLAKWKLNFLSGTLEDFNKAIEANNQQADYYVNRGLVYLEKKDTTKAIYDLQQALEIDPENSLALYNLSITSKNHQAALEALDKVVKLEDGFPSAYANRAFARLESGKYWAAIADYDTAIMLDNTQAAFYSNRGIALKKAQQYKRAIYDFTQAISLDIAWAKNYALRGEVFFKLKKYQDAVEDFSGALTYDPDNGNYFFNRALAKRRLGEKGSCCQDLQTALSLGMSQAARAMAAYCRE